MSQFWGAVQRVVSILPLQDLVAQFQRAGDENKLRDRMLLLIKPKLLILD